MSSASPKSKPTTRSSIRQSINQASKAIADAISKDGREASKNAKKASSRRSSVVPPVPSAPRASMGDIRPPSQVSLSKRTSTPDSKTLARRRASTPLTQSSPDEREQPSKALEPSPQPGVSLTRTSTLRQRNLNATALPKYRPKSVLVEPSKPPSPTRAGTRRRFSTSDDEKKEQKRPTPAISPEEKISRPISPLPHRAALRTNLTNSTRATPPTTPSKPKIITTASTTPAPAAKASPSRPAKIVKTGTTSTSIPRALSASSTSLLANSSTTPKSSTPTTTPKSTGLKAKLSRSRSGQDKNTSDGQSSRSSPSRNSPSPLARRKNLASSTAATSSLSGQSGNMSHISEADSSEEDSDAEDVALLLAPVAAVGAPTPAMPRIQTNRQANRQRLPPQTPSRGGLPSRANMSYVSPAPPHSVENSLLLRPPHETAGQTALRGSIMSWEQLANNTSVTIGGDEFGRMLSEIPAPFRSGAASPSLSSHFDIPESPCLSAIDSPGGFGSISQVLLPDVTPSPALHQSLVQSRFSLSPDAGAVESSTITLLRLQLAAAENTAKERLSQIQAMEEEFHNVQQAHSLQMEEMRKQAAYMESQWRAYDEQTPLISDLEEQLRQSRQSQEQAVAEAIARCQEDSRVASDRALKAERLKHEVITSARLASHSWNTLHEACEAELDTLRGDRALLSVLLGQLDQLSFL